LRGEGKYDTGNYEEKSPSRPAIIADHIARWGGDKGAKKTDGTHLVKIHLLKTKYLLKMPDVGVRGGGGTGKTRGRIGAFGPREQ
jgi:hypothetical protein